MYVTCSVFRSLGGGILKKNISQPKFHTKKISNHKNIIDKWNFNVLRAAFLKYRPKSTFSGTSQKIDFAHILLIGRP